MSISAQIRLLLIGVLARLIVRLAPDTREGTAWVLAVRYAVATAPTQSGLPPIR